MPSQWNPQQIQFMTHRKYIVPNPTNMNQIEIERRLGPISAYRRRIRCWVSANILNRSCRQLETINFYAKLFSLTADRVKKRKKKVFNLHIFSGIQLHWYHGWRCDMTALPLRLAEELPKNANLRTRSVCFGHNWNRAYSHHVNGKRYLDERRRRRLVYILLLEMLRSN